jgi:hypothetical protein
MPIKYFVLLAASALLLLGARTLTNSDQISWDITTPGQIKANPVYLPIGSLRLPTASTTAISAINTWTEVTGTFELCPFARDISNGTHGRICNASAHEVLFRVSGTLSMDALANNQRIAAVMARLNDDTSITIFETCSKQTQWSGVQTDIQTLSMQMLKPLKPGECFFVMIRNETSTANVEVLNMNLMIVPQEVI